MISPEMNLTIFSLLFWRLVLARVFRVASMVAGIDLSGRSRFTHLEDG